MSHRLTSPLTAQTGRKELLFQILWDYGQQILKITGVATEPHLRIRLILFLLTGSEPEATRGVLL
jgi:hypothetical protein